MAATDPTLVEFHIHQVAPAFHSSIARKLCPKNFFLERPSSATSSIGTNPRNTNAVNAEVGQLSHNIIPDAELSIAGWSLFKSKGISRQISKLDDEIYGHVNQMAVDSFINRYDHVKLRKRFLFNVRQEETIAE